jgi:hypothetical protein
VTALRSMTVAVTQQQQLDGVLHYLGKYSKHIDSLTLRDPTSWPHPRITLRQLPSNLQLSSLNLQWLDLQLQPGDGFSGVLGAAAVALPALKQLQLRGCSLLDSGAAAALAAALSQLPAGLEHLSIESPTFRGRTVLVPSSALQRLQQLTYLSLYSVELQSSGKDSHAWQFLQVMTRLVGLHIDRVHTGMPLGVSGAASAIALDPEHACAGPSSASASSMGEMLLRGQYNRLNCTDIFLAFCSRRRTGGCHSWRAVRRVPPAGSAAGRLPC